MVNVAVARNSSWCMNFNMVIYEGNLSLIQTSSLYYSFKLLETYLPLVLLIYSVVFQLNSFQIHFSSMIRIWVWSHCFGRHHFNKATLVGLSNIPFWKKNIPSFICFFKDHRYH